MNRLLTASLMLVAGLGVGGGASLGVALLRPPTPAPQQTTKAAAGEPTAFVSTGSILVPMTMADGQLTGYVTIECSLEVPTTEVPDVEERLPLLLHGINQRTFRAPLAAGPDGRLPDVEQFRRIVLQEARKVFGASTVRMIAVTRVQPAP